MDTIKAYNFNGLPVDIVNPQVIIRFTPNMELVLSYKVMEGHDADEDFFERDIRLLGYRVVSLWLPGDIWLGRFSTISGFESVIEAAFEGNMDYLAGQLMMDDEEEVLKNEH